MGRAEQSMEEAIAAYQMLQPGDTLLCALSGGGDSVCMTHFLTQWGRERGIAVAAAHYTHGLRPRAGQREREMTGSFCHEWGIPFFTEEGDTVAFAAQNKGGIEENARLLRYDFLRRTAAAWGANKIATAHHMGDQAETVLLHLIRGAGLHGLRGIPPVNGGIIRPLITTNRGQVEEYLIRNRLSWVEDETNSQAIYTRNRLRLEVMPLLEALHPGAVAHIAQAGFRLAQDAQALDRLSESLLLPGGLDAEKLAAADVAIAAAAVGQAYRRNLQEKDLTAVHREAVINLAKGNNPSAKVSLPGGIARREYGKVIFEKEKARPSLPDAYVGLGETIQWGEWEISMIEGSHSGGWTVPLACLQLPVCVRSRRVGDEVFMGKHHKSVKKLMIERKIPEKTRDIVPILCDNKRVFGVGGIGWEDILPMEAEPRERVTVFCKRRVVE